MNEHYDENYFNWQKNGHLIIIRLLKYLVKEFLILHAKYMHTDGDTLVLRLE